MKKILLLSLIFLTLIGVYGCTKEPIDATDNSPNTSDEITTTTEAVNPGTITIDEQMIEHIENAHATQLFEFKVVCDREWEDVYTDFVLANDMEYCRGKRIYITKKQIEKLKPVKGYDIFLQYLPMCSTYTITDGDLKKMDDDEWYDVRVYFRGTSDSKEYLGEVESLLEELGIDKSGLYRGMFGHFDIKIYPDDIEKLNNDERVNRIVRYLFSNAVDF